MHETARRPWRCAPLIALMALACSSGGGTTDEGMDATTPVVATVYEREPNNSTKSCQVLPFPTRVRGRVRSGDESATGWMAMYQDVYCLAATDEPFRIGVTWTCAGDQHLGVIAAQWTTPSGEKGGSETSIGIVDAVTESRQNIRIAVGLEPGTADCAYDLVVERLSRSDLVARLGSSDGSLVFQVSAPGVNYGVPRGKSVSLTAKLPSDVAGERAYVMWTFNCSARLGTSQVYQYRFDSKKFRPRVSCGGVEIDTSFVPGVAESGDRVAVHFDALGDDCTDQKVDFGTHSGTPVEPICTLLRYVPLPAGFGCAAGQSLSVVFQNDFTEADTVSMCKVVGPGTLVQLPSVPLQPPCTADRECEDSLGDVGPCRVAVCSGFTHRCEAAPWVDGKTCDDDDPCTVDTTCMAGTCGGGRRSPDAPGC